MSFLRGGLLAGLGQVLRELLEFHGIDDSTEGSFDGAKLATELNMGAYAVYSIIHRSIYIPRSR